MFTTRPELRGTFGMVASTHWLASAALCGQGVAPAAATVARFQELRYEHGKTSVVK